LIVQLETPTTNEVQAKLEVAVIIFVSAEDWVGFFHFHHGMIQAQTAAAKETERSTQIQGIHSGGCCRNHVKINIDLIA